MLNKVFSGFLTNIKTSELFTKKFSRRDFLKGTGLVFALLSLGNVANSFQKPQAKVVTKDAGKSTGGYGNTGAYGA
jgi:hypothetical protein